MDVQKYFFPLGVAASVIAVYALFRNQQNAGQNTIATYPNPASSGVGLPVSDPSQTQGTVAPVSYNVPATQLAPSPIVVLQNPLNPNPQASDPSQTQDNGAPAYLTFNFGPQSDLNKTPASKKQLAQAQPGVDQSHDGCGCGSSSCGGSGPQCGQQNAFIDGNGNVKLSSSKKNQLRAQNNWLSPAQQNMMAYLQSEEGGPGSYVSMYALNADLSGPAN
jgi:hypothetical protein